jgi:hypothetical protein
LLRDNGFTHQDLATCAMAVGMHYEFGGVVQGKKTINKYLNIFDTKLTITQAIYPDIIDKLHILKICIAISAADVKGANEVDGTLNNLQVPTTRWNELPVGKKNKMFDLFNYDDNISIKNRIITSYKSRHHL